MPIRQRITDPYSPETRNFHDAKKYGRPPTAPRKPSAEERKPFHDAIHAIPVGKSFSTDDWRDHWILPLMQRRFTLWGIELALYPTATRNSINKDVCTGVYVRMLVKHPRTGQFPGLQLNGSDKAGWYGRVIRWIEENCYGG